MRIYKFFFLLTFLAYIKLAHSQEIVVNQRGDSIVLNDNGTWHYYDNLIDNSEEIAGINLNQSPFSKSKSAYNKVKGANSAYDIWLDTSKWQRIPVGDINPEADLAFRLINGDAYGMVIYEEIEIPFENLSNIALENALVVAPDIKMIDREYRIVNGNKLLWMRMDGTTQGMKITYYSYYYSNSNGSIQFHTFTGQNLIPKYQDALELLLNGLAVKD